MHPTYIFQQGKIKHHANQQKILLRKKTQCRSFAFNNMMVYNLSDIVQRFNEGT